MENTDILNEEKSINRARKNTYLFSVNDEEKEMIEQKFSASGLSTKRVFFKINS